jgi:hypothetical protein
VLLPCEQPQTATVASPNPRTARRIVYTPHVSLQPTHIAQAVCFDAAISFYNRIVAAGRYRPRAG